MEKVFKEKNQCCGCSACKEICPKHCISMVEDDYGYIYPEINQSMCIDCKACVKVCPFINDVPSQKQDYVYAGISMNKNQVMKSSSGGAFFSICKCLYDDNTTIYGANLDSDLKVHHVRIENFKDIEKVQKSKYVQSEIRGMYPLAQEDLKQGKKVIFSGTPCQIAGLKKYLKRDYDTLFTIDFICHGVPSNKIFHSYVQEIEKQYGKKIKNIGFRDKSTKDILAMKIIFEDNSERIIRANEDYYLRGFLKGLYYREVCYNCKFAKRNRVSDITIGDFWGFDKTKYGDKLEHQKGISLIIFNSYKSNLLMNDLSKFMDLVKVHGAFAAIENESLTRPSANHKKREEFLNNLNYIPFKDNINKCVPKDTGYKIIIRKFNTVIRMIKFKFHNITKG